MKRKCYNCEEKGHYERECKKPRRDHVEKEHVDEIITPGKDDLIEGNNVMVGSDDESESDTEDELQKSFNEESCPGSSEEESENEVEQKAYEMNIDEATKPDEKLNLQEADEGSSDDMSSNDDISSDDEHQVMKQDLKPIEAQKQAQVISHQLSK